MTINNPRAERRAAIGFGVACALLMVVALPVGLATLAGIGTCRLMGSCLAALWRRQLRRLIVRDPEYPLELSVDHMGVGWTGTKTSIRLHWSVFEGWIAHPNGILLLHSNSRRWSWMPNRGAAQSTWADVTSMVAIYLGAPYDRGSRRRRTSR